MTDGRSKPESRHKLAVFTKSLDSVSVKSRLAQKIGRDVAHRCYSVLVCATLQCAHSFDAVVYVDGCVEDSKWLQGLPYRQQIEGDLGQRMLACFYDGITVLVGGDCPLVSVEYIQEAVDSLSNHDLVLGPTEDGGYVLIGMTKPYRSLFEHIPWSTAAVFEATMNRALSLDLKVRCLPRVWDVDSVDDFRRWQNWRNSKGT